jgi:hypothetical protein
MTPVAGTNRNPAESSGRAPGAELAEHRKAVRIVGRQGVQPIVSHGQANSAHGRR